MAKMYIITFSKNKELIEFPDNIKKRERELELIILENLFLIAMNRQKTLDKAFECRDCLEQIRNITDKEEIIKLTKSDIDYLKEAFETTADNRPTIWLDKCYNLFKQIKEPTEDKEQEEKKDV